MVAFRTLTNFVPIVLFFGAAACAAPSTLNQRQVPTPNILISYFQDFYFDLSNPLNSAQGENDLTAPAGVAFDDVKEGVRIITSLQSTSFDESTKAQLVTLAGAFLPKIAELCKALTREPIAPAIRGNFAVADANLHTIMIGVSRLTGVSATSLAPEM
ncbi:hypothetical protein RSOLAG22IIIB_08145 [Rhizoctonia solani]|uniref:Uncharacterized protein n=1 Tax=Rhizoctonia solani TaxID=456999 RepID=A0A0K6FS59_9AGAM|nr:hypothetical protein RSOLAG22IIIB_08145 [Rhizoctonia solani]